VIEEMSDNHETRPYSAARYEPVDFFLLRTPALPVETIAWIADAGDPSGTDDERRRRTRERLRELAGDPEIRRALAVASGDLVAALPRLAHDPEATDKKTRRAYSALLRYLTRMASRPTPFGRFSGVALGEFGASTTARLAHPALGRSRIRADMGWLLGLIKKLEADPDLRPHLRVTRNSSCYVAGDRVVLPYADVYGDRDNRSVRIRATPAVDTVLRAATTPVPYERLADELCAQFPQVERTVVAGLLDEMWDLNFLVSELRPPMTVPLPERYVAKQLAGVVGAEAAAEALDDVMDLAAAAAGGPVDALERLVDAQRALVPDHRGTTYQLDSAARLGSPQVSGAVGQAMADAASCLMRLSRAIPGHHHHLLRYRHAFLDRYGQNALVSVLEVAPDGDMSAAVRTRFRTDRDYLCELLVPWDRRPHDRGREHHERLRRVLDGQAPAVAAVERAVRAAATDGELWGTPASVLGSLAHMQINRLMKVDLHREARCYALWKLALRSIRGRPVTR
jgi:hypothetical protein